MHPVDANEMMFGLKRLAIRMLLHAALDIAKGGEGSPDRSNQLTKSRHSDSSIRWLKMSADAAVPFDYCCDILDYDPVRVREKILSDPQGFANSLRGLKNIHDDDVSDEPAKPVIASPAARKVFRI